MDEQKTLVPQTEQEQNDPTPKAPEVPQRRNWVTDLYDRMNISVKALDIAIVVLMVFIIAVVVIASKLK